MFLLSGVALLTIAGLASLGSTKPVPGQVPGQTMALARAQAEIGRLQGQLDQQRSDTARQVFEGPAIALVPTPT